MITVLFITAAVMLLAITFSVIAMSERRSTASSAQVERAVQLADAGSERARRNIVHAFNNTYLSISNFLTSVQAAAIPELAGIHTVDVDGNAVHWQIVSVSDPSASYGWIDVASTANLGGDATQTVVRRIGFGASSTFDLAMLSETTDCMFCHLRVNGDVGNLVFMRPGWGNEGGSGQGSGGSLTDLGTSRINGNVFAAQDITNDQTSGNRLNGAEITGVIERWSTNSALPVDLDGDGIADFPPISREVAMLNALGTIGGGASSCLVPLGGSFSGSCGAGSFAGTVEGNLILVGTESNPIDISGDVWVEGDVVISGYVTGLGGLYAGRNVYLAGDVQAVNPPYRVAGDNCVNEAGNTVLTAAQMAATGFSPEDACARRSIADDTDALRIAARGSIIVGDYTEYDADGNLQPYVDRQSSEFYRQQFGFEGSGLNRQYDRRNGDELRRSGSNWINADGQVVSSANRIQLDGYDASFRPGQISASGFQPWLSDTQYQQILGRETFSYNGWRWGFSGADLSTNQPARLAQTLAHLMGSGFPYEQARELLDRRVDFSGMGTGQFQQFRNAANALGVPVPATASPGSFEQVQGTGGYFVTTDDSGEEARYRWSGNTLRAVHTAEREYETQVNRVDAFLYANQRIAGKTSMQAMSITGGLVARDLGILAPGRGIERNQFGPDFASIINTERATACSNPSSDYYVYGSEDCALTVNYDHRLRNGGYGYNIIEGRIGITLDWRLADSSSERVSP